MNRISTDQLVGEEVGGKEVGGEGVGGEGPRAAPTARNYRRVAVMLALPLLLVLAGAYYWLASGGSVATDNAYVKQDIVAVSSEIVGPINAVLVRENQRVRRGDILFRIDPAPVEVQLAEARAQLAAAELQTRQLRTAAAGTASDIAGAQNNLQFARRALARQRELLNDGFTTRARFDEALHAVEEGEERLGEARAEAANAAAALAPSDDQPAVAAARAAIAKALLDLRRGIVRAPADGIVAKSSKLLVGQIALPGLAMLSLVRDQGAWVEANFKERDLAEMRLGAPATIRVDAYPELELKGHVASIGAGTGSEFSLLPAQNANGNWVKVTQRVPVRIAIDRAHSRQMIAGLSARVRVTISASR